MFIWESLLLQEVNEAVCMQSAIPDMSEKLSAA